MKVLFYSYKFQTSSIYSRIGFPYLFFNHLFINQNKTFMKKAILSSFFLLSVLLGFGQITTSAISGVVKNQKGEVLVGATVQAVHSPTGTEYKSQTSKSGTYVFPAVRPGGPYIISVSFIGYNKIEIQDINTSLGITSNLDFTLVDQTESLKEVLITGTKNNIFSNTSTGPQKWKERGRV